MSDFFNESGGMAPLPPKTGEYGTPRGATVAASKGFIDSDFDLRLASRPEIRLPRNPDHRGVVIDGGSQVAQAVEAYKKMRRPLLRAKEERGITSVAITSAAPADGKTVTAFNLAYCCAQLENTRVLLVDADMRT